MKKTFFIISFFLVAFITSLSAQYICVPVKVSKISQPVFPLNGTWKFYPSFHKSFVDTKIKTNRWKDIRVPGEWAMQGFQIKPGTEVTYAREFTLPASWKSKNIMLRCDAIYSKADIWVNGHKAGSHLGGMTAFELDITPFVHPGNKNNIVIGVTAETLADTLMSGSQYAAHSLGGILRKIYLYALPEAYLGDLDIRTNLSMDFRDAQLVVNGTYHRSSGKIKRANVVFRLFDPEGRPVLLPGNEKKVTFQGKEKTIKEKFTFPVSRIQTWDPEHPRRYRLLIDIATDKGRETIVRKIGFRRIEVVGNRLYINGHPVKMRGVNRHESHPLLGRSLNDTLWHMDAEIFKEGNVNYIRTSHYPPAEEFIEWCDSLGFIVELENPFCWVGHGANAAWQKKNPQASSLYEYLQQVAGEVIAFYRNHPSVTIWSMANESAWGPNWERLLKFYQETDPARPVSFHDQAYGGYNNYGSKEVPIAVYHYPGPEGDRVADTFSRPLLFGEYCHINCYNRREIAADPGVRDDWGRGFKNMWDKVYISSGGLGGAIWAGIDDVFYMPDGKAVGYGEWGVIDGWRRKKPEYYHMKKTYAPVRIINKQVEVPVPAPGEPLKLEVENRFDFTNLKECRIIWELGGKKGNVKIDLPPKSAGILRIKPGEENLNGKILYVSTFSPQGFLVDKTAITIGQRTGIPEPFKRVEAGSISLDSTANDYTIKGDHFSWQIERQTGRISAIVNGEKVMTGGPDLMMLPLTTGPCVTDFKLDIPPLNNLCKERKLLKISAGIRKDTVRIKMTLSWHEAHGTLAIVFPVDGSMHVHYTLTSDIKINPRQWGLVFSVDRREENLEWYRKGLWTLYPPDHTGRIHGKAVPFLTGSYRKPAFGQSPGHPWRFDANELGSNDFRSSKNNVYWLGLTDDKGVGLLVEGEGKNTVRSWVDGDKISFLVAGFSTGGGDLFFSAHYKKERRPLSKGDTFSGKANILLVTGKKKR